VHMATLMLGVWSLVLDSSIQLKHRVEVGPTYIQRRNVSAIWSSCRCCHPLRKQLLNQKSSIRADDTNRRWSARIVQSRWNLDNHHWKLVYTMLSYACGRRLASVLESNWRCMMKTRKHSPLSVYVHVMHGIPRRIWVYICSWSARWSR